MRCGSTRTRCKQPNQCASVAGNFDAWTSITNTAAACCCLTQQHSCTHSTLDDCGESHDTALKGNLAHRKQSCSPHRHRPVATQTSQVTAPYTESTSGNGSVIDSGTPITVTTSKAAKPAPVFEWTKCWWPAIPSKSGRLAGITFLSDESFWRSRAHLLLQCGAHLALHRAGMGLLGFLGGQH